MVESYRNHFLDSLDDAEINAYALWRRFERLGSGIDVLVVELSLKRSEDEETLIKEVSLPMFRGFTRSEFAGIQLGKLVSLKEGGQNQDQLVRYNGIINYFFGDTLFWDYSQAKWKNTTYDPEEIAQICREFCPTTAEDLPAADFVCGLSEGELEKLLKLSPEEIEQGRREAKEQKKEEQSAEQRRTTGEPKSYEQISDSFVRLREEIDRYLLSKIE